MSADTDDPDETAGRKLYRAKADTLARAEEARARHPVRMRTVLEFEGEKFELTYEDATQAPEPNEVDHGR